MRSKFWVIVTLLGLFFNGSYVAFLYWYIYSGVHPNPRNPINIRHSGWEGYSIMLHLYGFGLCCLNIYLSFAFRDTVISWIQMHRIERRFSYRSFLWFRQFLAVPILVACFFSVAPMSAPYVAINLTQKHVWDNACKGYPLEIILHGRYFHSPNSQPTATFLYWVNGIRTPLYSYAISLHNGSDNWTFNLQGVSPGVEVPTNLYPFTSEIAYDAYSHIVSGTCNTSLDASTSICLEGQYVDTPFLSLNITDIRTGAIYRIQASDPQWFYADNSDGPSLILHDVESNGKLGPAALKTAVTWLDCTLLKLCSSKVSGPDLIVPVGRILKAQDSYGFSCSRPTV